MHKITLRLIIGEVTTFGMINLVRVVRQWVFLSFPPLRATHNCVDGPHQTMRPYNWLNYWICGFRNAAPERQTNYRAAKKHFYSILLRSLHNAGVAVKPLVIGYLQARYERITGSPAALMAPAVVVLKHETSTLYQSHNFISPDLKFGVDDNVTEITIPSKIGSDPMSGRDATCGQQIRVLWLFVLVSFILFFLFFNRATAHTREPIIAHNSSKDAVWCSFRFVLSDSVNKTCVKRR